MTNASLAQYLFQTAAEHQERSRRPFAEPAAYLRLADLRRGIKALDRPSNADFEIPAVTIDVQFRSCIPAPLGRGMCRGLSVQFSKCVYFFSQHRFC